MVGADLVRVAARLLPAFTLLFGNGRLWHLMVSAAVSGAATAFCLRARRRVHGRPVARLAGA